MPGKSARIWRAKGGYQDAPPPPPPEEPSEEAPMPSPLVCYPSGGYPGHMFGELLRPYLACPPGQYPVPYGMPQSGYRTCPPYIQGPVGVGGLCLPMPGAYVRTNPPRAEPRPAAPKPAKPDKSGKKDDDEEEEEEPEDTDSDNDGGDEDQGDEEEDEEEEEEEAEEKPKENAQPKRRNIYAPPRLQPNANYMYDWSSQITMLHIFNKASPVWEPKYWKERPKFKMFHARVSLTVKMVIKNVLAASKEPLDPKEWAATEAIERGGGEWEKGSTVTFDSSRSDGSLMAMGWGPTRGSSMPPVWLVVHKVGFKK